MGQFSWRTADTDRSILVDGSVPCKMLSPDGRVWHEPNYEGYGKFGGKDYFELLAELNGLASDRQLGIDLLYSNENNPAGRSLQAAENGVILPKLVSSKANDDYANYPFSESCDDQGFYERDDEDADEDEECWDCGWPMHSCTCDGDED